MTDAVAAVAAHLAPIVLAQVGVLPTFAFRAVQVGPQTWTIGSDDTIAKNIQIPISCASETDAQALADAVNVARLGAA